jgi:nicotinamidase-related amidase
MVDGSDEVIRHRWAVEDREIRRHEQRRGRRHAFERLDPGRTALVVIDLVPFFVDSSGYVRGIVEPVNEAAALLRSRGGTVAWVVPAAGEPSPLDREFYGDEVAATYGRSGGEGPIRDRLWPDLAVETEDLLVEKRAPSAFFPGRCDLHDELTARGIDSLLVAGTVANVCCESSIRDARTLGYRVVLLADATAAPTDDVLNATLRTVYRSFGDVRSTADLPGLLRPGTDA